MTKAPAVNQLGPGCDEGHSGGMGTTDDDMSGMPKRVPVV